MGIIKPCYTIEELHQILQIPIYKIADGLYSDGVTPYFNGKPADLSQWGCLAPIRTSDFSQTPSGEITVTITRGLIPEPDPDRVVVGTKDLPQTWLDSILKEEEKLLQVPVTLQPIFVKESLTYPPELDAAIKAWQAVSVSGDKGKPKLRIKNWLNANAKELSNDAKNRISIVANWDRKGGPTKTE